MNAIVYDMCGCERSAGTDRSCVGKKMKVGFWVRVNLLLGVERGKLRP